MSSVFQALEKLLKSVMSVLSVSFRWVTTPKRSGLILETGCTTVWLSTPEVHAHKWSRWSISCYVYFITIRKKETNITHHILEKPLDRSSLSHWTLLSLPFYCLFSVHFHCFLFFCISLIAFLWVTWPIFIILSLFIVLWGVLLSIAFLVIALGITIYIYDLLQFADIRVLPPHLWCGNPTST